MRGDAGRGTGAGRGTRDAGRESAIRRAAYIGLIWVLVLYAAPAEAQRSGARVEPEVRVDAFIADRSALHGGVGVNIPAGNAVRVQAIVALGALIGGENGTSGRVEVLAHYLVDPRRQARWGFYGGGGVSARYDEGEDWHGELVVLIGAERRLRGWLLPFYEIGYGGGVRVSAGLRVAR